LVEILEEKDIWTAKHTYNLALRDSKIPEKIQEAMTFFCEGKSIDVLVSEAEDINAANKYGNVARCAMYLGDIERAIRLLCKSYTILTETMSSYSAKHNLGYAAQWIGDFLHVEGRVREAAYFYIHARNLWEDDMPSEANRLMHQIKEIFKGVEYESMTSLENWQITKYCNDWVSRQ
jgi:tetratricopeptide (TPR) repeat protein